MAKGYISWPHEQAILYMEAKLLADGQANTTDATNIFGLSRQNMAKLIKVWKEKTTLPVTYDSSIKSFVLEDEDPISKVFSKKEAIEYARIIEKSYHETAIAYKRWSF